MPTWRRELVETETLLATLCDQLGCAGAFRTRNGGVSMDLRTRDLRHLVDAAPGLPDQCSIRSMQTGSTWKAAKDDLIVRWTRPADGSDNPDPARPEATFAVVRRILDDVRMQNGNAAGGPRSNPAAERVGTLARDLSGALSASPGLLPDALRAQIEAGRCHLILTAAERSRAPTLLLEPEASDPDQRIPLLDDAAAERLLGFLGVHQFLEIERNDARSSIAYAPLFHRAALDPDGTDPVSAVRIERRLAPLLAEIRRGVDR